MGVLAAGEMHGCSQVKPSQALVLLRMLINFNIRCKASYALKNATIAQSNPTN